MQTKHSGIFIEYNELRNKWTADDEDKEIDLERNSLSELKKAIDDRLRTKQDGRFKRFTAIKKGKRYGWDDKYIIVTITSILEDDYRRKGECWIIYEKIENQRPEREKIALSYLYKDTPENREVMKFANDMIDHIDKEKEKLLTIIEKLEKVSIKED